MEINFRPRLGAKSAPIIRSTAPATGKLVEAEGLSRNSLTGQFFISLAFLVFAGGMFWLWASEAKALAPSLITGFFTLIGLVVMGSTIRNIFDKMKYGDVPLWVASPQPAVGGILNAAIRLPAAAADANRICVDLICTEIAFKMQTSGKNRGRMQRREEQLWNGRKEFRVVDSLAKIQFTIPLALHASTPGNITDGNVGDAPRYKWTIRVTVDVPGVDLDRVFPIKVLPAQPGSEPAAAINSDVEISQPAMSRSADGFTSAIGARAAVAARTGGVTRAPILADDDRAGTSTLPSTTILILTNLLPIAGVAIWDWQVGDVVLLYWVENLIIGGVNVLRMAICIPKLKESAVAGNAPPRASEMMLAKGFLISFFIMHYGAFCAGHGMVLRDMFVDNISVSGDGIMPLLAGLLSSTQYSLAILGLAVSHLFSFIYNFLLGGEYRNADLGMMMFRPYKRIVVVHIFIIAGGLLAIFAGTQLPLIIGFILIKIILDTYFHRQEHELLQQSQFDSR